MEQQNKLMVKIFNTAVLTLVSGLVIGFFTLIGWMAKTQYSINSSVEVIKRNQNVFSDVQEKQIDVYNKLIFDEKEKINLLEEQIRLLEEQTSKYKTRSLNIREEIDDAPKETKKEEFRKFDNDIKQQIQQVIPKGIE